MKIKNGGMSKAIEYHGIVQEEPFRCLLGDPLIRLSDSWVSQAFDNNKIQLSQRIYLREMLDSIFEFK